ncbi:MAG TPA: BMP family ABC transporter substrate-binding protein [Gaiellaceae bacterium]|nr:BMP family ABC transporter substrate-binding protein [Gaiellaceae bacterium]
MKVSRWIALACVAALAASVAATAAFGGSSRTTAPKAGFVAALVSDVAGFNDNGFNKNQLVGLNRAAKKIGGKAVPLVSHSASDYTPNFNSAIRDGAKVVIAAGFLLAPTMKTYSKKFPNVDFAITDDSYKDAGGGKNVEGLTYATQEGGCLVGVLAAKEAQKMGGNTIGAVGGIKIPPVDSYIAGYKYCADKVVPGTKVIVQYSNDFNAQDKCATVAQNEMGSGATVIFQVAGGCGIGALKAAASAGNWGIGVDADEFSVTNKILTSAIKKTDVGVYDAVTQAASGKFHGGSDLLLNLKNNGVGVGRIAKGVPASWIKLMNSYRSKIIAGKLKPPAALGK